MRGTVRVEAACERERIHDSIETLRREQWLDRRMSLECRERGDARNLTTREQRARALTRDVASQFDDPRVSFVVLGECVK